MRIGLKGTLRVFYGDELVATHILRPLSKGWVTVPAYHENLWATTLNVQRRPLYVYEEVSI